MKFIDLHNDAITELSPKRFAKYIKKADKIGVEKIFISVWTTEMKDPLEQIRHYSKVIKDLDMRVELLLHIEDLWFINENNIEELISLAPYSVGLVWNDKNNLASGSYADGNLTELGAFIVKELVKNDIQIDLAHLNKSSFWDVINILKDEGKQPLCSHTCFEEIHPHPRNIDREQIQAIVDSGGLIGLTLVPEFLTDKKHATVDDVKKHLDYFMQNFGDKNIAFGTDFFGTRDLSKGLKNYSQLKKFLREHA